MAQEKPNPIKEWLALLKEQWPVVREQLGVWVQRVREDPHLLWRNPRSALRHLHHLRPTGLWIVSGLTASLLPAVEPEIQDEVQLADFHVICSDEACGHHFVIRKPPGFHRFPVKCPKCEQEIGMRALPCNSSTCQGKWVIPEEIDGQLHCPVCGAPLR